MSNPIQKLPSPVLDLVRVSDVEAKPVDWLWPGRIAKGKISLIAGHPGQGKSTLTVSIAAIVSSGGMWPVDKVAAEQGNVVILSAEDDIADTLRPRLMAAGADIDRVQVLKGVFRGSEQRLFNLMSDTQDLMEIDASLLIIDPITAYLGGIDSHKNAEVRSILSPLGDLAVEKGMAVVGVSHLNKSVKLEDISRVSGSMAFVAAARAVFIVTEDEQDESRRFFLPLKNNIGPDSEGLAFRIEPRFLDDGIVTSVVEWEPQPINTAEGRPLKPTALARAKAFLEDILSDGPVETNQIKEDGEAVDHSWATLRRAAGDLEVTKRKRPDGPWEWELRSLAIEDAQDVQILRTDVSEQLEHLRGDDGSNE